MEIIICSGIATKEAELESGNLKAGERYIIDNYRLSTILDPSYVEIYGVLKNTYHGIGPLSWFTDLKDIRPETMQKNNLY